MGRVTLVGLVAVLCTGCSAQDEGFVPVKSWLYIEPDCAERVLTEGQEWPVTVEYNLDPDEAEKGLQLYIWVAGPFIYLPDGKYTTERQHVGYPNMARRVDAKPGRHTETFTFTVPPPLPRNRLLIICYFQSADGERWPWEARRDTIWFQRKDGFFELETDKPGNLFTYDEPVRINARIKVLPRDGTERRLKYRVYQVSGDLVAEGDVPFKVLQEDQLVPIDLDLEQRGTFRIEAEVEGWETRSTAFARIPDTMAITGGKPTPFGMTNVVSPAAPERLEEMCKIARRLGLTSCRAFTRWYDLEPGPGEFRLDPWAKALDIGNRNGIETWMCIYSPPAWVLRDNKDFNFSYSACRCDWDAWGELVEIATTRLKGKLYGWEWLNEITPGGTDTPVADYLQMVRIGTETARRIDPDITTIMAGGLWPRSFRTEMLRAGVGQYVDVMPIHYANGEAVREAKADLEAVGLPDVAVWDDESAKGVNAWNVPPLEVLGETSMSNWVLTEWTDELAAGCERIIYFGGVGDACGNYSYLLDDLSPRPVAATLAVFTSKLWNAKPVGVFALGKGGLFHLFDREGEAVLVCSSYEEETVPLQVGTDAVTVTDYQGNETRVTAEEGTANLELGELRCFVEGADLDILKAYCVPEIVTHRAAMKRTRLVETPRVTVLTGTDAEVNVRVTNLYDRPLAGAAHLVTFFSWLYPRTAEFSLAPGESTVLALPIRNAPDSQAGNDAPARVECELEGAGLPKVSKPVVLAFVSSAMLGSLLPNGDFETANAAGDGPEGFGVDGQTKLWATSEGLGDGLGERVLRFQNTGEEWGWCGRTVDLRGGQTYLYTAWVWNQDMHAGSNVTLNMADGSKQTLYDVQVFTCGTDSSHWQMHAARINTPPETVSGGFSPVVRGTGTALFDNLRVTLFEGTDFAAEAYRTQDTPTIDGDLRDWPMKCPVPLIGENQLTKVRDDYPWTPENLNGVAYLMWDDESLYLALQVRDDVHHATQTSEAAAEEDCIVLGIDPTNRSPGGAGKAFALTLSAANPGGGGGRYTIYRPEDHAGGLRPGHLLRDSSVYEMAVVEEAGRRTYEVRLPLGDLGGVQPGVGTRLALSLQLNDNDGDGLAAQMNWGEGLSPAWRPEGFGVVTFVE